MSLESIQNYCTEENFAGNTHIQCVPVQWVEDFPEFAKDGHNFSTQITLKAGKVWLLFPCAADTLDFDEKERSTSHGSVNTPTISGFVPDDTPQIASVLNSAKANQWIVILYYKTGEAKVIGSLDTPARFSSSFNNRGSLNSGKGYNIEFFSQSAVKSFFVEETPDPMANGCLPVTITVNSEQMAVVPSGNSYDIEVVDDNGNQVDVELNGNQIKKKWWERNPDWLDMPEITAGDNKFAGIYAVFEDGFNAVVVRMSGSFSNHSIDWGDGSMAAGSGFTNYQHTFDYSTITSDILISNDGRNYKQVLINVDFDSDTTGIRLSEETTPSTGTSRRSQNFLDLVCSSSLSSFTFQPSHFSSPKYEQKYLERIIFFGVLNNLEIGGCSSLRVIDYDFTINPSITITTRLREIGDVRRGDGSKLNFNANLISCFTYSLISEIGDIETTDLFLAFDSCINLRKVGNINFTGVRMQQAFDQAFNVQEIGEISVTSSLTDIGYCFRNNTSLSEINFVGDMSGVSSTVQTFNGCRSLRKLTLPNIPIGFDVSDSQITGQRLQDLGASIGPWNGIGLQDITLPAFVMGQNVSIFTSKGYNILYA